MNDIKDQKIHFLKGLVFGALSFTLWGLLPLYWQLVQALSAYQVFAHRVVWSFLVLIPLLVYRREFSGFMVMLKTPKNWLLVLPMAFFISVNWLTYIWSVTQGYVIEASLGYFINPLVLTAFGTIFFKEKLAPLQWIAIGFAGLGVAIKTLSYGQVPWIAIILAVSFAIYGVLKKRSPFNATQGLAFETLIVGIPSIFYILLIESQGSGIHGNLPMMFWLLIAVSGLATATPLVLYGESTKHLPLTYLGLLQYIAPTISLILGIYVFKEPFDTTALLAFSLIWLGLLLFTYASFKGTKGGGA